MASNAAGAFLWVRRQELIVSTWTALFLCSTSVSVSVSTVDTVDTVPAPLSSPFLAQPGIDPHLHTPVHFHRIQNSLYIINSSGLFWQTLKKQKERKTSFVAMWTISENGASVTDVNH